MPCAPGTEKATGHAASTRRTGSVAVPGRVQWIIPTRDDQAAYRCAASVWTAKPGNAATLEETGYERSVLDVALLASIAEAVYSAGLTSTTLIGSPELTPLTNQAFVEDLA